MFRGGIASISNMGLHDDELLGNFKSRVHTVIYDLTDSQLGVPMLQRADPCRPFRSSNLEIDPESAHNVGHYLIGELPRLSCPIERAFGHQQDAR